MAVLKRSWQCLAFSNLGRFFEKLYHDRLIISKQFVSAFILYAQCVSLGMTDTFCMFCVFIIYCFIVVVQGALGTARETNDHSVLR